MTELDNSLRREVRIVDDDALWNELTDRVLQVRNTPPRVKESPILIYQALEQECLADPGFPDQQEVGADLAQFLQVLVSPDWSRDNGGPPSRRHSRQRSRHTRNSE